MYMTYCVIHLYLIYINLHVQIIIIFTSMYNRTWDCYNFIASSLCLQNNHLRFSGCIYIYLHCLYLIIFVLAFLLDSLCVKVASSKNCTNIVTLHFLTSLHHPFICIVYFHWQRKRLNDADYDVTYLIIIMC